MSRNVERPAGALGRRLVGLRPLELMRFGAVGASSTILYLAVYGAAVVVGIPFGLAALVAFLVSAVWGYHLHHRWTFHTNAGTRGGLVRWLILQGTVLALNVLGLWALVALASVHQLLAQVILLPLFPLAAYLLSRRLVFGTA